MTREITDDISRLLSHAPKHACSLLLNLLIAGNSKSDGRLKKLATMTISK